MGIFLNDANLEQALLVSLGFFGLALLGWLLVQLTHWENSFNNNRAAFLQTLQEKARALRLLRQTLQKTQNLPDLHLSNFLLPPDLRGKWRVAGWIIKVLSSARWARS